MDDQHDTVPERDDERDEFASSLTPELRAQEEYLRAQIAVRVPARHGPDQREEESGRAQPRG